jgi:hypothetical protein
VKCYLRNMVELNMMEEEFRAHRMEEGRCAAYFVMQCEIDREEYKEKPEEERAHKREKTRSVKEVYARGGEKALMNGKWPRLLRIDGLFRFDCTNVLYQTCNTLYPF